VPGVACGILETLEKKFSQFGSAVWPL